MNTKETARALNVDERTVRRHAAELGLTKNGVETVLDEKAVTIIKNRIERSGRNDLDNIVQVSGITTDLEMMVMDARVSEWKTRKIQELQELMKIQEEKLQIAAPKVQFYDAVTGSKDTIDIGEVAKILAIKGLGRNNLFETLREKGILMQNNQPYQKYIDAGYFRTIESSFTKPDGTTHVSIKTVVYQKGLDYIRKVVS